MKKIWRNTLLCLLVAAIFVIPSHAGEIFKSNDTSSQMDGGWYKTFGGEDDERFRCVEQTADGGYIIAGDTKSIGAGDKDAWLIKTDGEGNEQWSIALGGPGWDGFGGVQQLPDGGFIAGGWYYTGGDPGWEPWLVRTDAHGKVVFDKIYAKPGFMGEFTNVRVTADGGYVMAGIEFVENGGRNALLAKTDIDGNLLWMKTYGTSTNNEPILYGSFEITPDGGYIAVTPVYGGDAGTRAWLMKTDAQGNIEWEKTLAYDSPFGSQLYCLGLTNDGGCILGGNCGLFYFGIGGCNIWITKTDSSGNKQWEKSLGAPMFADICKNARQTSDGGYIITGRAYGIGGFLVYKDAAYSVQSKICVYKLSESGAVEWNQLIQGYGEGICIRQTSDGGYIVVGYTGNEIEGGDGVLAKLDSNGNINQQPSLPFSFYFPSIKNCCISTGQDKKPHILMHKTY